MTLKKWISGSMIKKCISRKVYLTEVGTLKVSKFLTVTFLTHTLRTDGLEVGKVATRRG